jgi:aryl-alcohol dehydrogenase-like predicted oxidoreductase
MGVAMSDKDYDIAEKVEEVAKRHNATMGQICIAWMLRQPGINTILIGQRTVKQLKENIAALEITLTDQDLKELDEVSKIDYGFPHTFLGGTNWEDNRFTSECFTTESCSRC